MDYRGEGNPESNCDYVGRLVFLGRQRLALFDDIHKPDRPDI
jgi:hypothetical protein